MSLNCLWMYIAMEDEGCVNMLPVHIAVKATRQCCIQSQGAFYATVIVLGFCIFFLQPLLTFAELSIVLKC